MYKRRVIVFLSFILLVFAGLLGRLYDLQVIHGEDSRKAFEEVQTQLVTLPAMRGAILDNHGNYLAKNVPCFEFCMDYRLMSGDDGWIRKQQRAIARGLAKGGRANSANRDAAEQIFQEMSDKSWSLAADACGSTQKRDEIVSEIVDRVEQLIAKRRDRPIEADSAHALVTELDDATASVLRSKLEGTVGLSVRPAMRRQYPAGETACHIIGVVGPVTPLDRDRHNNANADALTQLREEYRLDDVIGQFGVEKLCEPTLRGVRGYRQTAGTGKPDVVVPARDGRDVRLSLDIDLQNELTKKYRQTYPGKNGCAVLLNVSDGTILAMISIPTFDLNKYRQDYAHLLADDFDFPMIHRAITRVYAPGSTAKPLAALASLAAGDITAETVFDCQGSVYPGRERPIKCTGTHGPLDLVHAIGKSCNVYFYHVGERLEHNHPGRMMQVYREFGFGESLATGLAGEAAGKLPDRTDPSTAGMLAFGQGPIAVTPLHVASAMATIARRGQFISPSVLLGDPDQVRRKVNVPDWFYDVVQKGMHGVTQAGGTAQTAFHDADLGFEVCGKSGTAQTAPQWQDRNGDHRMQEDEILRKGNMVWFSGFAPYGNPKIAFAVIVEYVDWDTEGGGAAVAAPFAIEALRACKERGYIK
jgi:penicillin-binding protein 2